MWLGRAGVAEHDAGVRVQGGEARRGHAAELEEGVDVGARDLHLHHGVLELRVGDALVLVGLRAHAERVGPDAQVGVHRDEDGRPRRVAVAHVDRGLEDREVLRARLQADQRVRPVLGDRDAQGAAAVERDALGERRGLVAPQIVEEARDGAGVAAALGPLALELVDLLDREDGDDDVVVLELEDRVRVVEQDVGVEDVVLLHDGAFGGARPGLP